MNLLTFKETSARIPWQKLEALFELVTAGEARERPSGTINLVFTDDDRIRDLNREFRGKDRPTDVLSFSFEELEADGTLGEVYISVPTARRQAVRYGTGITGEYLRLFCHGLLHLFGYDHEDPEQEILMLERQDEYLARLRVETG